MTVVLQEVPGSKVIEVQASDKLTKDDYEQFVPEVERLIQEHGKVRILFDMRNFHGWSASALWEDVKFDLKHFKDIERLAMIGDKSWEKWMAGFCRPFTSASIRYFDQSEADQAQDWIKED